MAAAAGLCVSGVVCHLLLQFGFQSRSLKAVYYLQQAGIKQVGGWVFRQTGWKQVRPLPLCVCVPGQTTAAAAARSAVCLQQTELHDVASLGPACAAD